jgi:hypothetical protein
MKVTEGATIGDCHSMRRNGRAVRGCREMGSAADLALSSSDGGGSTLEYLDSLEMRLLQRYPLEISFCG